LAVEACGYGSEELRETGEVVLELLGQDAGSVRQCELWLGGH
jgi:hypothetical protein